MDRTRPQVDQSSCRNLKKPASFVDLRVGSRRFSPLPTVSEPFLTGSLPPDSCRMFSDNSGNFPVGLQPDLSGTYRNRGEFAGFVRTGIRRPGNKSFRLVPVTDQWPGAPNNNEQRERRERQIDDIQLDMHPTKRESETTRERDDLGERLDHPLIVVFLHSLFSKGIDSAFSVCLIDFNRRWGETEAGHSFSFIFIRHRIVTLVTSIRT